MFEKGKSARCTLFYYYVDDLCSITRHTIDPEIALLEGCRRNRTTTVTPDIPSVQNSAVTATGQQVSVGWTSQAKAEVWTNAVHTDGRGVSGGSWDVGGGHLLPGTPGGQRQPGFSTVRLFWSRPLNDESSAVNHDDPDQQS